MTQLYASDVAIESTKDTILCCPCCKGALSFQEATVAPGSPYPQVFCRDCGKTFPVRDDLIDFNHRGGQIFSKRFMLMRKIYNTVYTPATNLLFIPCGGAKKARIEVLERLEIPYGARILETGIGTGDNLPHLEAWQPGSTYYGIDNQPLMLKKCQENLAKWKLEARLFIADAEALPFQDHLFDVVFHLGAINIFNDPERAILEMIRVAKPGTRVVIADETQKAARWFNLVTGSHHQVVPPIHLVPKTMHDIRLTVIWNGYGYLIEFRIPD